MMHSHFSYMCGRQKETTPSFLLPTYLKLTCMLYNYGCGDSKTEIGKSSENRTMVSITILILNRYSGVRKSNSRNHTHTHTKSL